jgi:hypothetical protein
MTHSQIPLVISLTPKERKRLLPILRGEGVDASDPIAVKNWLLYQAGIEPEASHE